MKAYERLLKYVVVRTPSDEESGKSPSSECQFKLAGLLKDEMTELGLSDVKLDKHCYLYGRLPATPQVQNVRYCHNQRWLLLLFSSFYRF